MILWMCVRMSMNRSELICCSKCGSFIPDEGFCPWCGYGSAFVDPERVKSVKKILQKLRVARKKGVHQ